jgi:hypothetical protein
MYRPRARYFVVLVVPRAVHSRPAMDAQLERGLHGAFCSILAKATTENAERLELPSAAIDAGVRGSGRVACRSPVVSIGWWVAPYGLETGRQTGRVSNDQQRLDRIVEWMQTVGDPWMRDEANTRPEPGSDLAADDAEKPETSPLAHRGIVMALDHLGSVVDAVVREPPKRLKAYFTVLRTALECGARVCWLLESDSSDERRLRGVQYRFQNLEEQRKAITGLSGTHIFGETEEARQQILVGIEAERAALTERALSLGAAMLTEPPNTLWMIRDLVDVNTFEGTSFIQLWRTGSASVHGHYWADEMRDNPRQFDHMWFQPAIQGAMLFINDAMKLYHSRATTQ